MKFILGLKIGMSQMFDEDGSQIPITLVEAGPCKVLQIKTKDKDGYEAVQVGFKKLKDKKVKKTQKGKPFKYLKEFKGDVLKYKEGDEITVAVFKEGDSVKISGVSKGKGFAGGVKKWGFAGRPRSRGMKHELRTIGSIGGSTPARVVKGRRMPGRMGGERKTIKNLKVRKVDPENNILWVKGAVPGRKGTLLEVKA